MALQSTGYWTFFCNPAKWQIDEFLAAGIVKDTYQVPPHSSDQFLPGQLGVIRVSIDKRNQVQLKDKSPLRSGVYAVVEITSKAKRRDQKPDKFWIEWSEKELEKPVVEIRYLRNLLHEPILIDSLISDPLVSDKYLIKGFQRSAMPLLKQSYDRMIEILDKNLEEIQEDHEQNPDEIDPDKKYPEGTTQTVSVNRYERSRAARKECLLHYGLCCSVCGLDFESEYGEIGKGFIHVHHLILLAEVLVGYEVDPINDLRPVCPNCHAMLHKGEMLTIEELKQIMSGSQGS